MSLQQLKKELHECALREINEAAQQILNSDSVWAAIDNQINEEINKCRVFLEFTDSGTRAFVSIGDGDAAASAPLEISEDVPNSPLASDAQIEETEEWCARAEALANHLSERANHHRKRVQDAKNKSG